MRNTNISILSGAATANIAGNPIDANQLYGASFQAVATGSPVGTVQVQCSNDVPNTATRQPFIPTNWTNVPGTSSSAISAAGATMITLPNLNYGYIRVIYTFTSGTGTIAVTMNAQSF